MQRPAMHRCLANKFYRHEKSLRDRRGDQLIHIASRSCFWRVHSASSLLLRVTHSLPCSALCPILLLHGSACLNSCRDCVLLTSVLSLFQFFRRWFPRHSVLSLARFQGRHSVNSSRSLVRFLAWGPSIRPLQRPSNRTVQVKLLNNTQHITLLAPNALDSTHTLPHSHAPSLNPVLSVRRFLLLCAWAFYPSYPSEYYNIVLRLHHLVVSLFFLAAPSPPPLSCFRDIIL